ncbi:MAG: hypothetical protein WCO45_08465 [Pseudanabaena sp. ELA607]
MGTKDLLRATDQLEVIIMGCPHAKTLTMVAPNSCYAEGYKTLTPSPSPKKGEGNKEKAKNVSCSPSPALGEGAGG